MSTLSAHWTAATAGLTPEKVALLIAVGFALGTFPVLGVAGVLCLIAAVVLRLHVPALQVVGQMVTPAQYALLLPLARLGARVIGVRSGIAGAAAQAVTGWFCVCVPMGMVLYFVLLLLMRSQTVRSVSRRNLAQ